MALLWFHPGVVLARATIFLWGLSFGGLPTIFQAAVERVAGKDAELATAMLKTTYNLGIFAGGAAGGILLDRYGTSSLLLFSFVLAAVSFATILVKMRAAFR
jgi:predicted MFS family arabinose efflux permease